MSNDTTTTEPTAMQEAMGGCAKLFGYGVVGMALIFADIAFLVLIGNAFGSNPVFQAGAFLGAFTTSVSVFGLLIGKARWFRPGPQLLAAYGFTVLEGLVMGMNVALCYAIYRHTDNNIVFQIWQMICPWTPLIAGAGWVVLFSIDPAQQQHHNELEQQDKEQKAELSYKKLIFDTRMKVKRSAVTMLKTELEREIVTPERVQAIQQTARSIADDILSDLSGEHVFSQRTVQGSGYAIPQSQAALPPAPTEEEETQPSASLLDKAWTLLPWNRPQPPAHPVSDGVTPPPDPSQQTGTPVQPYEAQGQDTINTQHLNELIEAYHASGDSGIMGFPEWLAKVQQSPLVRTPMKAANQTGATNGHK